MTDEREIPAASGETPPSVKDDADVGRAPEPGEFIAHVRGEKSWAGPIVFWAGVGISLVHIYLNTLGTLSELWFSAIHFASFGFLAALIYPLARARRPGAVGAIAAVDVALGLIVVASVAAFFIGENAFYERGSYFVTRDWIFSILAVLMCVELTRRTTGWIIPTMIVLSLTYVGWWGRHVTGIFHFPGLTWETILFRSFYGDDGMFGLIARISSTYVFMFILFGGFLVRSGAGDFIINIARISAGRLTGGPGLVAVFGSCLFGSISGSAVANTVGTGVITIPLMRRAGYEARFAAGVEAAASTGGQLMPPIMGAGAFVMSSYTQIPYLTIVAVSFLPALMYFLSVAFWVRIEAKRKRIAGLVDDDVPPIGQVLRDGWHSLVPIAVLVGFLIAGYTPTYAAGIAIISVVVGSWLGSSPMGVRAVLEALAIGARNMTSTAVLLISVGIVVGVIGTTGIGNTFSLMIVSWAQGNLLITIVLVALASLVLGMGLPVTAAYIVLATLSAPALYELITRNELIVAISDGQVPEMARAVIGLVAPDRIAAIGLPMDLGAAKALVAAIPMEMMRPVVEQTLSPAYLTAALLSAHMIIFWLSQDSNVTPPVCLTAFAAAAIAKTPPMATGFTAWKIAKGLYIVPLLFAYTPFLVGDIWQSLMIFSFGTIGIYCLSGAWAGFLEGPLPHWARPILAGIGVLLLWPNHPLWNVGGLVIFALFMTISIFAERRAARRAMRPMS
ncbi:MAG: TRAP transporter fused permease subunit [Hyphomicrobiales bacterium]|nr:TRAP transporter fused permease subunit [Hyphomicrobiales bacterium]